MKIGLLLGSFNPITIAHITMASSLLNSKLCDKILFVVANHNPFKELEPAPFEVRCEMIEDSIGSLRESCEVCKLEKDLESPVYSYITIELLKEKYPTDELFLIVGTDSLLSLPKWKNFETHINGKIGIIEVSRGDECLRGDNLPTAPFITSLKALNGFKEHIQTIKIRDIDVSSSLVREMISKGMNPYPFITENTYNIITKYNLYK